MSGAMTATTDEWMQFYHQQPLMAPIMEGFSDATVVTTSSPTMSSEGTTIGNSCTTNNNIGRLTPKASAFKPIKRRSRASKKTPTTLLNANTNNFRELVQRFTGCASTSAMSFALHKGPITLNFQQGSSQQQVIQHSTSGTMSPIFGTRATSYNRAQHHHEAVPLPWQKQLDQAPKQQSGSLPMSYDNSRPSTEVSDGLVMVNDIGLHELTVNAFSNYHIENDGYFM